MSLLLGTDIVLSLGPFLSGGISLILGEGRGKPGDKARHRGTYDVHGFLINHYGTMSIHTLHSTRLGFKPCVNCAHDNQATMTLCDSEANGLETNYAGICRCVHPFCILY